MRHAVTKQELAAVHAQVKGWHDAFAQHRSFAALTESEQLEAGPIAIYFAEYCVRYLDLAPADWNCEAVRECCIEILPRKVTAELAFFESVAPVLGAFFRFLGDQGLHPQGQALAKTVDDIAADIVSNAQDSRNWGMAKHLAMAAKEAGLNLADQSPLDVFAATYDQLALHFMSSGPPPASATSPANLD